MPPCPGLPGPDGTDRSTANPGTTGLPQGRDRLAGPSPASRRPWPKTTRSASTPPGTGLRSRAAHGLQDGISGRPQRQHRQERRRDRQSEEEERPHAPHADAAAAPHHDHGAPFLPTRSAARQRRGPARYPPPSGGTRPPRFAMCPAIRFGPAPWYHRRAPAARRPRAPPTPGPWPGTAPDAPRRARTTWNP